MEKVIESMSQKEGVNGDIPSTQLGAHNLLRSRKPKIKTKSKVSANTNSKPNSPCTNSTTSDNDDANSSCKGSDMMVKNGSHASSTKSQVAALETNNVKKATNR